MLVVSWNSSRRLAVAACALLGVVACAPNSARTPLERGEDLGAGPALDREDERKAEFFLIAGVQLL